MERPNGTRSTSRTLLVFLASALIAPSLSTVEEELRLVTQADVVLPDATGYRYRHRGRTGQTCPAHGPRTSDRTADGDTRDMTRHRTGLRTGQSHVA